MKTVLGVWRSGWAQGVIALAALVLAFVVIWWRGPDWDSVFDAFKVVIWSWIVLAFVLNVVSTLFRALSWRLTVGQALPPEHQPKLVHVLSSFGVGLLANAVVPGRLGELARVATLRRHLPDAPAGTSATLVGTVFAHRLFDLVPASILVVWVLLTAEVPHWAVVSITIAAAVGFALFTVAWLSARRHDRPVMGEGMGSLRELVVMGRQGLSVLKAPVPLAGAILLQCMGWLMQLLAVYVAMQAFGIDAPLPAAGLVLVLMNIATIVPLWPGNIGLVQAAVAIPLRNYGVPYAIGFAYGLALQAIEIACGVTLGLIAIAREGISLAMLRRMEDDERSSEDALEGVHEMVDDLDQDAEHDGEAARESTAVSR
ncbi:MAG: lysylphosphatidylglycerol synthase transmembrane domain-containing protein [Gaiellaceae bacterium]